ncbi:class I SAM-dependent methyltransferase [Pendulispora albinea]|uniref:S-adenosyl-L-methionine-dependent methyltransferase n=1 Tax=Pendulispora albinea TaxID=2741071 RepID=A0ABZ2MC13_9BACT
MQENRPSTTAMHVAVRRAVHQILDRPLVFEDPLAVRIVGEHAKDEIGSEPADRQVWSRETLRAFLVARSRFTEDALEWATLRGVRQYVILGAGLDTFAYRNRDASLRVFEVDYPATQAWKRERLAEAGIVAPPSLTFAPIDFEKQTLSEGLANAGFDFSSPAFFSWLGVANYLTKSAVMATLHFVAQRPAGSEIVFDFAAPPDGLAEDERRAFDVLAETVASLGEPWISSFDPSALSRELSAMGFRHIDVLAPPAINARYFSDREDDLRVGPVVGRILHARV